MPCDTTSASRICRAPWIALRVRLSRDGSPHVPIRNMSGVLLLNGHLTPLLRGGVLIGQPALGLGLDFRRRRPGRGGRQLQLIVRAYHELTGQS